MTAASTSRSIAAALAALLALGAAPSARAADAAPASGTAAAPAGTAGAGAAGAPAADPMAVGNRLYDKGEYAAAAEQYRKAAMGARSGVNRAFAWFNLGNCHVQTKAYHKAVVAYRRSLEQNPNFSRAWYVLGEVYYHLGAIGDAVPCYRRVLEIDGPTLRAYQMLGECALQGGDVPEALRNFEAALKIEPDQVDVYLAMAEAHARIRDFGSAQKVMEEALLMLPAPPADAYFYLGQLYELDGNDRKAVRAYEEGLAVDRKRTDYVLRIAGIHEKNGDDFLALLTLEQAVQAGVRRPDIRVKRGVLFFGQKRYERALEEFQAAWAQGSLQGRSGIENVAAAYHNAGDRKKAQEILASLREP
jgi:tetratricopeptide (TPR) repeat protein